VVSAQSAQITAAGPRMRVSAIHNHARITHDQRPITSEPVE
jgi:hypothetical protein